MEKDYTVYNQQYQYMDRLLKQMSALSGKHIGLQERAIGGISEDSAFLRVMKDTQTELDVPESMDDIFEEAAALYDVPSALLKAIGKAESGFNPNAVSGAGAQGVMQLMPATARSLGVTDSFDARSNIMGGAKYIADKLKKYEGNIDLALAAYNAGSGNVAKYGGVPPFKETQNYIKKVKQYMGSDIKIGKTVNSKKVQQTNVSQPAQEKNQNRYFVQQGQGYTSFDLGSALYVIEMMRMQMQGRMFAGTQNLMNGEESLL